MIPIEQKIPGTWRSYKLFRFSGKVQNHNTSSYTELSINEDNILSMLNSEAKRHAVSLKPGEWKIDFFKKRWYLWFRKRQAFEIITLDSNDLVLLDMVTGDKIFFAKIPHWYTLIEPVVTSIRYISAGNEKVSK